MSALTQTFDFADGRYAGAHWAAIPSYLDRRAPTVTALPVRAAAKAPLAMGFSFAGGRLATVRWSHAANEGSAYAHAA
jgi:hypothetical protein